MTAGLPTNASYRRAQPPERRVATYRREESPRYQRKKRPSHRGQTVPLTPEILQMFNSLPKDDWQYQQLFNSTQESIFMDRESSFAHSDASRSTTMSSVSQRNQYHGGDAVISASAMRWHRAAAACAPKDNRKLPMVMCSPPGMLGNGHYVIRFLRASLKQEFGIAFDVLEARNGRLEAIIVSQDLPQLGIRRLDCLQSINGVAPSNLLHCRSMIQEAYSIILVMQPWSPMSLESQSTIKTSTVMAASRAVDQPLLCLSEAVVTDAQKGKFLVSLHRISLALPFSMPDWSQNAKSELVEDFPHLAVQTGDRLVSVNGVRTRRRRLCQKLFANALSVDLVFRRDPNTQRPPKHNMQPLDAMGAAVRKNTITWNNAKKQTSGLPHVAPGLEKTTEQKRNAVAFKQAGIASLCPRNLWRKSPWVAWWSQVP